jgi:hypothetical protein
MRNTAVVILTMSVVVIALGGGCSAYHLKVNAYLSQDLPFPRVEQDASATSIAIVVGTEPDAPLLKAEVERKIAALVRNRAYTIDDQSSADYLLTCWLSIEGGFTEMGWDTVYSGPRLSMSYVYHGDGWHAVRYSRPGEVYRVPYSYTTFRRAAELTLYERERWEAAEEGAPDEAVVWSCTATSVGQGTDLRTVANYLLAAAFKYFGADTGREVAIGYRRDDPAATRVAEAGR